MVSNPPFAVDKSLLEFSVPNRHLKVLVDQDIVVLTLTTPQLLDDMLTQGLLAELFLAVDHAGVQKVVLDLEDVKAVCSGAIELIKVFGTRLSEKGGRLQLCNLSPHVAEMLQIHAASGAGWSCACPLETSADLSAALTSLRHESSAD